MSARTLLRLGALAAAALGVVGAVATPAAAEYNHVDIVDNGRYLGAMFWNRDPWSGTPGDSLQMCDDYPDGIGLEARLIVGGKVDRVASTAGHNSPYCSPWKSGDLPEGHHYIVKVYKVKGGVYTWWNDYDVWS
ncbi:hypothetical protein [Streptomyces sp. NPDC046821]|uniref:hypothetical protein n=1 Tax=Streptomyces sp. NPDC046821 TaxID=3154702 RepID=UPI00340C319F